jgi:hypothetical protein
MIPYNNAINSTDKPTTVIIPAAVPLEPPLPPDIITQDKEAFQLQALLRENSIASERFSKLIKISRNGQTEVFRPPLSVQTYKILTRKKPISHRIQ